MAESELERCARAVAERLGTNSVMAVLTGAGVSSESGVPTYRGPGGLWEDIELRMLAESTALLRFPRMVWEFFQQVRELLSQARPNAAHYALAQLDDLVRPAARMAVITQNVDGLHQAAGSRHVIELHGNAARFYCMVCGARHDFLPLQLGELPPRCACGGIIRPDVVLFGEALPESAWQEARAVIEQARVLLVIGTTLEVEPAASLPLEALRRGALIVEINLEPTPLSEHADFVLRGFAGHILPLLVEQLARVLGRQVRRARVPKA